MMVGHAALAFALATGAALAVGLDRERALLFGATAGAFGLVPDVDIGYAIVGLFTDGGFDPGALPDVFWETGNIVHRGLTHSLVVGAVTALLLGLLARDGPLRSVAVAGLAGLVALTLAGPGTLEAGVMASFLLAGGAVVLGARLLGLGAPAVTGAALVGLLSHPFGDVFTGTSPTLLYPFDLPVLPERVLLSSDPTLHLLGAFGTELAAVWLAVGVYFLVRDRPFRPHLHRRAVLGTGYASAVVLLPLPTLAVSYQFVFGVLAVGAIVTLVGIPALDVRSSRARHALLVTGLATATAAWSAYVAAYVLFV
jgi:membrane-bound metal-dependent hydrolase YbcI (DUF457 family)